MLLSASFVPAPGSPFPLPVGADPQQVAIGHFNADALPDVAVADFGTGQVSVFLGQPGGTLSAPTNIAAGAEPDGIAVGDFNGDTFDDVIVANNTSPGTVTVLFGDGAGAFPTNTTFTAGAGLIGPDPQGVGLGDFNHDGNADIVTANRGDDSYTVVFGDGAGGRMGAAKSLTGGVGPFFLAVGDYSGDGISDVAITNGNNTVSVLLGFDGGGVGFLTAAPGSPHTGITTAYGIASGLFNADAIPDLAVTNLATDQVSILLGTGGGAFGAPTLFSVGDGPSGIAVADVNFDGKLDLLTANNNSGDVSVIYGTGTGTFSAAQSVGIGVGTSAPLWLAIGDFTGDGRPDIVTSNNGSENVSLLLNTTVVAGVVNGTNGDDAIRLVRDAANPLLVDIFINNITTTPTLQLPLAGLSSLTINGLGGNDTLTVQYANGDPIPVGGLFYDGGPQTATPGDRLFVTGTGAQHGTYLPDSLVPGSGVIHVDGKVISFTGLEPVTVSGFNEFTFTTPNSNDVITIDSPAAGQNRVNGTSGGVAFESLTFFDVAQVKLDTATNDGPLNLSNDRVTFSSDLVASNISSFTVDLGPGNDTADGSLVTSSVPLTLLGGAGDDTLTGGAGSDRLEGGEGRDQLTAGAGNNALLGGPDDDLLIFSSGQNTADGGTGENIVTFSNGTGDYVVDGDFALGHAAATGPSSSTVRMFDIETLDVGPGSGDYNLVIHDLSQSSIRRVNVSTTHGLLPSTFAVLGFMPNSLTVEGSVGDDNIALSQHPEFGPGGVVEILMPWGSVIANVFGASKTLILDGLAGNDTITVEPLSPLPATLTVQLNGGLGDDVLSADAILNGGPGNDTLIGGAGNDTMDGGAGNDTFLGNGGTDTIIGGAGGDTILVQGTPADDAISATLVGGDLVVADANGTTTYSGIAGSGVERIVVEAGDGTDTITVAPLPGTAYVVRGGAPIGQLQQPAGDLLNVLAGGLSTTLLPGPEPDSGTLTVLGNQPVSFDEIEQLLLDGFDLPINTRVLTLANGQVILYDSNAIVQQGAILTDVVRSDFRIYVDKQNDVRRVDLVGNPTGLGIIINSRDGGPVAFRDARKGPTANIENLDFLYINGAAPSVYLHSPINGFDLSQILVDEGLAGGGLDLDGDALVHDRTAFFSAGPVTSFTISNAFGDVAGDVVILGADPRGFAVQKFTLQNVTIGADADVVLPDGGIKQFSQKGGDFDGDLAVTNILKGTFGGAVTGDISFLGDFTGRVTTSGVFGGRVSVLGDFTGYLGSTKTPNGPSTLFLTSGTTINGFVNRLPGGYVNVTGEDLLFGGAFAVIDVV